MRVAVRRLRRAVGGDDGSVTVEAALGIASIVTVLLVGVGGVQAVVCQLQVVDAAREAARVAAVEGPGAGGEVGRAVAPEGAMVSVAGGAMVTAEVVAPAAGLPGVQVRARAVARAEPGVGER